MAAEFTLCRHAETGQEAELPTEALAGWQKLGWEAVSESRTLSDAHDQAVAADVAVEELAVEVPDLTVKQVLDEVGDDPEKAAAALEAEQGRTKPRASLVARLKKIVAAAGDVDAGQTGEKE
jgi:hypothetical protein